MEKISKIKAHFRRNKKTYLAAAGTAVLGTIGGAYLARKQPEVALIQKATLIGWKNKSIQLQFVERSTPSTPVHLKGTKNYWDSISAAARDTGISRENISKNINGHIPNVKGNIFEAVDLKS